MGGASLARESVWFSEEEVYVETKTPCLSLFIGQVMDDDGLLTMCARMESNYAYASEASCRTAPPARTRDIRDNPTSHAHSTSPAHHPPRSQDQRKPERSVRVGNVKPTVNRGVQDRG